MKILVTGSTGHLGEGIMRVLADSVHEAVGLDILTSPWTQITGSITDRQVVKEAMADIDVVLHTATLHKPHVATHSRQDFVDTNITGTLNLLEEAVEQGVKAFIFSSTTSTFGDAMKPADGAPAVLVTEKLTPVPKNIYGVTKTAAEDLCALFHRRFGLPCLALRTSRFFPEEDDAAEMRDGWDQINVKVNELLHRRVDLEDAVSAHLLAMERAPKIGFGRYIISATSPFQEDDLTALRTDAPAVVRRYADFEPVYDALGWKMFPSFGRVYVNDLARHDLGWAPRYTFAHALERLQAGDDPFSPLSEAVGKKGYHEQVFEDGPFPVE